MGLDGFSTLLSMLRESGTLDDCTHQTDLPPGFDTFAYISDVVTVATAVAFSSRSIPDGAPWAAYVRAFEEHLFARSNHFSGVSVEDRVVRVVLGFDQQAYVPPAKSEEQARRRRASCSSSSSSAEVGPPSFLLYGSRVPAAWRETIWASRETRCWMFLGLLVHLACGQRSILNTVGTTVIGVRPSEGSEEYAHPITVRGFRALGAAADLGNEERAPAEQLYDTGVPHIWCVCALDGEPPRTASFIIDVSWFEQDPWDRIPDVLSICEMTCGMSQGDMLVLRDILMGCTRDRSKPAFPYIRLDFHVLYRCECGEGDNIMISATEWVRDEKISDNVLGHTLDTDVLLVYLLGSDHRREPRGKILVSFFACQSRNPARDRRKDVSQILFDIHALWDCIRRDSLFPEHEAVETLAFGTICIGCDFVEKLLPGSNDAYFLSHFFRPREGRALWRILTHARARGLHLENQWVVRPSEDRLCMAMNETFVLQLVMHMNQADSPDTNAGLSHSADWWRTLPTMRRARSAGKVPVAGAVRARARRAFWTICYWAFCGRFHGTRPSEFATCRRSGARDPGFCWSQDPENPRAAIRLLDISDSIVLSTIVCCPRKARRARGGAVTVDRFSLCTEAMDGESWDIHWLTHMRGVRCPVAKLIEDLERQEEQEDEDEVPRKRGNHITE